jgi:hypothetical protein
MKRTITVLLSFLFAFTAGIALAQDAPNKDGSGPVLKAQPMKAGQEHAPDTYGSAHSSFYRMGASEFTGMQLYPTAFDTWNDVYYSGGTQMRRYGSNIGSAYFVGTPHLPSGAQLIGIYVNDCVNSAGSLSGDVRSCTYYGTSCTVLAPISTIAGCGYDYVDLSGAGFVVNNGPVGNQLAIRLVTGNTDGSDSFAGVTVEYKLQVSPAPGTATFNDVPTSDPAFQWIEAFNSAAITAGCSVTPPLFCPDNFVTRRQMAVFIAKALGLQWP